MVNTELRIGNWISMCKDPIKYKDFHQVTNLSDDEIGIHNGAIKVEEYYPIPITPEILEKCGFEKLHYWYRKNMSRQFSLVWGLMEGVRISGKDNEYDSYHDHIQHLHQLQNLYFCLTGTELTINL